MFFLQFDTKRTESTEVALVTAITGAQAVNTGLGGTGAVLVLLKIKKFAWLTTIYKNVTGRPLMIAGRRNMRDKAKIAMVLIAWLHSTY